jgi:hypothetical protein
MKKAKAASTKKLPTKEKPTKLDMPFEDAIQLALNTPIKKSKVKK